MLDCDNRHRWFHGTCVGIPAAEEADLLQSWLCDHCRLSTAVTDQRQRIARLLALPCQEAAADDEDGERAAAERAERDGAMGEVGALCTETETARQLLLNFLQSNAAADAAADAAQSYVLCEWHAAATEARKGLLCDLYQEQQVARPRRAPLPHNPRGSSPPRTPWGGSLPHSTWGSSLPRTPWGPSLPHSPWGSSLPHTPRGPSQASVLKASAHAHTRPTSTRSARCSRGSASSPLAGG